MALRWGLTAGIAVAAGVVLAAPMKMKAASMPVSVRSLGVKSLTGAQLTAAQKTTTRGRTSPDKKTLTFTKGAIRLMATTGPENDMLSYRIAGLRNPTLIVPARATLRVLFVNSDEDMTHNLRLTALRPPFAMHIKESQTVGSHSLPHLAAGLFRGEEMAIRIPSKPGTYSYVCTVTGHAKGGMYGTLIVR